MAYQGIFIRDVVGETPESPGTSWTNSPDIICTGTTPLENPGDLVNPQYYAQGLPSANVQTPGQDNKVYVRGINKTDGPQTSTIYMYFVDTSIVLWPQNWLDNFRYENVKNQNWVQVIATKRDEIVAPRNPFYWRPPEANIHYCLVAWAQNGEDQSAPKLDQIGTVNDMAKFILNHPNVGWRNTIKVDGTKPDIQDTCSIIGPKKGGIMNIGLVCDGLPKGGEIEFSITGPNISKSFPKTVIDDDGFAPTFLTKWQPGDNKGVLDFRYWKKNTNPPDGSKIIPITGTYTSDSNFIERVKSIAPNRLVKVFDYGDVDIANGKRMLRDSEPQQMFLVGSVPYEMG